MKFRKHKVNQQNEIFIKGEWITLLACANCKTVVGLHTNINISNDANKIRCCSRPHCIWYGNEKYIEAFIKKWEDKK